jgi:phosphohistidine phosphatase
MKRLIVMRHATAAGLTAPSDFERPLTSEGHREAERVGAWLGQRGYLPELALCSTALRVRETWAAASRGLGVSPPVRWDRVFYDADAADLMQEASEVGDDADTVILIAHNPSVTHFAFALASHDDPEGRERLRAGFRPATAAVFELRGEAFSDLPERRATLVDLVDAGDLGPAR